LINVIAHYNSLRVLIPLDIFSLIDNKLRNTIRKQL